MKQRGDPGGDPITQGVPQRQGCGNYFCKCYFDVDCEEIFPEREGLFDSIKTCNESTGSSPPADCDSRAEELKEYMFDNSTFSMFGDHGGSTTWVGVVSADELEYLSPQFGYSFACSTCDYGYTKADLFCTNMLRKGAIGYIGAVSGMYGHHFLDEFLEETFVNNKTIGEAFKVGKNKEIVGDWVTQPGDNTSRYIGVYGMHDLLLGDPTFEGGKLK